MLNKIMDPFIGDSINVLHLTMTGNLYKYNLLLKKITQKSSNTENYYSV